MGREQTQFKPGNDAARKHGAYSLERKGLDAMTKAELLTLLERELQLSEPDGRLDVVRRKTTMGLAMEDRIQTYLAEQVAEGEPLGELLSVIGAWTRVHNSNLRWLKQLDGMDPGEGDDLKQAELERIRESAGVDHDAA